MEPDHRLDPYLSEEGQIVVHMAERIGGRPLVLGNHVHFIADWDVAVDWLVRDIIRVDEADRQIYFTGGGREGGNPFTDYQLPQAILKFRQGFGRLIRSSSDTGIIACLDQRLVSRPYGRHFISALPQCELLYAEPIE